VGALPRKGGFEALSFLPTFFLFFEKDGHSYPVFSYFTCFLKKTNKKIELKEGKPCPFYPCLAPHLRVPPVQGSSFSKKRKSNTISKPQWIKDRTL
jgi:hypothetical protein